MMRALDIFLLHTHYLLITFVHSQKEKSMYNSGESATLRTSSGRLQIFINQWLFVCSPEWKSEDILVLSRCLNIDKIIHSTPLLPFNTLAVQFSGVCSGDERCLETCEDHRWSIKNISDRCRTIEFSDRSTKEHLLSVQPDAMKESKLLANSVTVVKDEVKTETSPIVDVVIFLVCLIALILIITCLVICKRRQTKGRRIYSTFPTSLSRFTRNKKLGQTVVPPILTEKPLNLAIDKDIIIKEENYVAEPERLDGDFRQAIYYEMAIELDRMVRDRVARALPPPNSKPRIYAIAAPPANINDSAFVSPESECNDLSRNDRQVSFTAKESKQITRSLSDHEFKRNFNMEVGIPKEFICPISGRLMKKPVVGADGLTYDKKYLVNCLKKAGESTEEYGFKPDNVLRARIREWMKKERGGTTMANDKRGETI
ncbi:DgyrCDS13596 [Dimorphilus gyrociliatus]|uniref:DgyrCDS13596 n=1 Tax=Dimorphilus gyrociliatus TaxID=2664684 RepID=A0A7I8WB62_9ANNE|nr:DgyrCDS13596 [Dimorphilus gyrociliatus]